MKKDAMQRFEEKIDRNGPIIRLELVPAQKSRPGPLTLADLAAVAGYADQAQQMTREVQRFADCTPRAVIPSCTLTMSDLFKTDHPTTD